MLLLCFLFDSKQRTYFQHTLSTFYRVDFKFVAQTMQYFQCSKKFIYVYSIKMFQQRAYGASIGLNKHSLTTFSSFYNYTVWNNFSTLFQVTFFSFRIMLNSQCVNLRITLKNVKNILC